MSDDRPLTMEELREYDEAGYRTVGSLWPGDSFTFRKQTHVVKKIQKAPPRHEPLGDGRVRVVERVIVVTQTPSGPAREMSGLNGKPKIYQPTVTFDFHPMLLFPSAITDEHFQAEGGASWVDNVSAGGMW